MNHEKFIGIAHEIVRERVAKQANGEFFDTFVVWSCKTLQNSKCMMSASIKGAPYFEITLNGDKQEIYVDTYRKESNECIKIKP